VSPRIVWDVLTDYNRIATFVPGLKVSRLLSGAGEPLLLEQKGGIGLAMFSFDIDVVARVEEQPFHTIRFEAVGGNMREMRGEWNVEDLGEGSRLRYRLHVVPGFWVPPVIGPAVIRRNFLDEFDALIREMMRRAAAPVGSGGIPAQ
ncbi:MAG TPA: SRPBCC family protein, partial [Burkholderiales bacterium]|nr:SRPBCC family protein [Burkholderiales bacterium]